LDNVTQKYPIILYIDPPFDFRDGMSDIYNKTFQMIQNIKNNNIFMITFEHQSNLKLPQQLNSYKLYKTKKFGNSSLSYYR
jgi:16S rRNA G966 N2-methylase RsmD